HDEPCVAWLPWHGANAASSVASICIAYERSLRPCLAPTSAPSRRRTIMRQPPDAVVFDLDGVIVDSEHVWDEVRAAYTRESGGRYTDGATRDMMGMSSPEWSAYMASELGVAGSPDEINAAVVERMLARYGEAPPLIRGAVDAVHTIAQRWPVAIASSSNRELID